jgi:site-specific DNA recombinase
VQGYEHTEEYNDPGGKSYKLNRPVFQQMLRDAKAGLFDVLVVARWDRFSRLMDQQGVAVYQLKGYGVQAVSATEQTGEGPMGALLRTVYGFNAELQLYKIREVTTGGRKKRTQAGKILTGPNPLYGYVWGDPERGKRSFYVEDSETAPVVRLIYSLVLAGMPLRSIAFKLERDGIPTPMQVSASRGRMPKNRTASNTWRHGTIYRMLNNPAYCGRHSAWRHETVETSEVDPATGLDIDRVQLVARPDDHEDKVWFTEQTCPSLVSEADWQRVQVVLTANQQNAPRNLRDREAGLLRGGLAVCGYCKRVMQLKFHRTRGEYRYYCPRSHDGPSEAQRCEGRSFTWNSQELDDAVWRWFMLQFENPDLLRAKFEEWKADQESGQTIEYDQLASLDANIAKAVSKRTNCLRSMEDANDEEDRVEYKMRAETLKKSIKGWIEEREQLAQVLATLDAYGQRVEDIVSAGAKAKVNLAAADFETKRDTLRDFGVRAVVKRKPDFEMEWALGGITPASVVSHSTCTSASPNNTADR